MAGDRAEFQQQLHASALSKWELGDLLGIHPHLLPDHGPGSLGHLPARLVVKVARHLDMHVARPRRRTGHRPAPPPPAHTPEPADLDDAADVDALTVLNALATATAPLTTDQLADRPGLAARSRHGGCTRAPVGTSPLNVGQTNVLLARPGPSRQRVRRPARPHYGEWRQGHLDTKRGLRVSGVLYAEHKPQALKINPEVLYSFRCQETRHADGY